MLEFATTVWYPLLWLGGIIWWSIGLKIVNRLSPPPNPDPVAVLFEVVVLSWFWPLLLVVEGWLYLKNRRRR